MLLVCGFALSVSAQTGELIVDSFCCNSLPNCLLGMPQPKLRHSHLIFYLRLQLVKSGFDIVRIDPFAFVLGQVHNVSPKPHVSVDVCQGPENELLHTM